MIQNKTDLLKRDGMHYERIDIKIKDSSTRKYWEVVGYMERVHYIPPSWFDITNEFLIFLLRLQEIIKFRSLSISSVSFYCRVRFFAIYVIASLQ